MGSLHPTQRAPGLSNTRAVVLVAYKTCRTRQHDAVVATAAHGRDIRARRARCACNTAHPPRRNAAAVAAGRAARLEASFACARATCAHRSGDAFAPFVGSCIAIVVDPVTEFCARTNGACARTKPTIRIARLCAEAARAYVGSARAHRTRRTLETRETSFAVDAHVAGSATAVVGRTFVDVDTRSVAICALIAIYTALHQTRFIGASRAGDVRTARTNRTRVATTNTAAAHKVAGAARWCVAHRATCATSVDLRQRYTRVPGLRTTMMRRHAITAMATGVAHLGGG